MVELLGNESRHVEPHLDIPLSSRDIVVSLLKKLTLFKMLLESINGVMFMFDG